MKFFLHFLSFVFVCNYANIFAQCNNVALNKPVTTSGFWLSNTPDKAVNGSCGDAWNSGDYAPESIEVDLLSTYTINNINVMFDMTPNGNVYHEIYTSPDMITWTLVDVMTGFYVTGQLIERCYSSSPLTNVRGVRIVSISSPSWIAIFEMGIYTLSTPAIPTITASGPLTFCQGNSVTLTSSAAFSYSWSTGATTQSITVNTSGIYSVTTNQIPSCVIGSTSCTSCTGGTGSVTITVNPIPVSDAGPDIAICSNATGNIGTVFTPGYTYSWSPATGLSSTTVSNPTVTLTNPGTTTYKVITAALGCTSEDLVVVTVHPLPVANFANDNVCLFEISDFTDISTIASGTITGWQWDFGDGSPIDNNQNPSHLYATHDTFYVTLTVTSVYGCTDMITQPVV
ncbi:MAG: PKD domain-containing protein, partial [Bacteroidota bacterium]